MMEEKWFQRAKRLLRSKKITLEKVGRELGGLDKSSVSLKLSGNRPTTVEELIAIANLLEVSLDEICSDDPAYTQKPDEVDLVLAFRSADADKQETLIKIAKSLL